MAYLAVVHGVFFLERGAELSEIAIIEINVGKFAFCPTALFDRKTVISAPWAHAEKPVFGQMKGSTYGKADAQKKNLCVARVQPA